MVAELTGEHNVHFHGIIDLKDIEAKDKLLNKFRRHTKIFGRKTCNQVQFEDSYKKYMRKSFSETSLIIKHPILLDILGIFSMAAFKSDTLCDKNP
jgi:hypothetical protein